MFFEPLLDRGLVPDLVIRAGIRRLLAQRLASEKAGGAAKHAAFVRALRASPIAAATAEANAQHYEVPAAFFEAVLGPRLKYSCGLWENGVNTLAASEEAMLARTAERARLVDGQRVLDLGCGWGSFSLYLAERHRRSHIVAVSNSASQRTFILARAAERGLTNLEVRTADINVFDPGGSFDRIVSVEMLEHVRNYERLFERIQAWLNPEGLLFAHIFCHRELAYPFEVESDSDWMARHFFTGGIMPSAHLFSEFSSDKLSLLQQWTVDGRHYEKTSDAWLASMDAKKATLAPLFVATYGADAERWWQRWRIFFLSCAELFGYRGGREWHVAHYLFRRV